MVPSAVDFLMDVQTTKATAGGGVDNLANATKSTIFGGSENLIASLSDEAIIGGGLGNSIGYLTASEKSTITGERTNAIDAVVGSVVLANTAEKLASVVVGGKLNDALGKYSVVGGGKKNICASRKATVSGGRKNSAYALGVSSGGLENTAYDLSAVGGGYKNYAGSRHGVIAGGVANDMKDSFFGIITGGKNNRLSFTQLLFGEYGIILSGESNTLQQPRGIAAGTNATVTKQRSTVFSLTSLARNSRPSEFVVACAAFALKIDGCSDLTIDASNLNLLRSVMASNPASEDDSSVHSRTLAGDFDLVLDELESQIASQITEIQELSSMLDSLLS